MTAAALRPDQINPAFRPDAYEHQMLDLIGPTCRRHWHVFNCRGHKFWTFKPIKG